MNPADPGAPVELPRTEALLRDVRRGRLRKLTSFGVGLVLVLAAAWAAGRDPRGAQAALNALGRAPWHLVALAVILPVLSWAFTTMTFWSLTRRHGAVGVGEMSALMGSSWLLNFLPLKPGLVGRIAYHRSVNNIPIARSLEVIGSAILCGAGSILTALMVATVARGASFGSGAMIALFATPIVGFAALGWIGRKALAGHAAARLVRTDALSWRYADLLVWAARYMVAFELVGRPVTPGQAIAVAAVSQAATLLPLIGNGLGIREWAVGLVAAALPAWYVGAGGNPLVAQGLSADLVNRVFEIGVAIPIGVLSTAWIGARMRRLGRDPETGLPEEPVGGGARGFSAEKRSNGPGSVG